MYQLYYLIMNLHFEYYKKKSTRMQPHRVCTKNVHKRCNIWYSVEHLAVLEPVVQSIVSLTTSLRHKFVKQISAKVTNTLLFFVEKM